MANDDTLKASSITSNHDTDNADGPSNSTTEEFRADNIDIDLAHLYVHNREPLISLEAKYLTDRAQLDMKFLFSKLQALAAEQGKVASGIKLPQPTFILPRQKPLPAESKPKTKWEEYAEKKGIKKKKRERMVWDEQTQSWKPRWGYKRGNTDQDDWVVEVKENDDALQDKFVQKKSEKKLRVLRNRQKELRNQERQDRRKSKDTEGNMDLPSGIANDVSKSGGKRGKKRTKEALDIAQVSTASLGRFDDYQAGEPKRKLKSSKKRRFEPADKGTKERDLRILERILKKQ